MDKRRMGIVYFDNSFINDLDTFTAGKIFGNFIPINIIEDYELYQKKYIMVSDFFDIIDEGEKIPTYIIETGKEGIKAKRIKYSEEYEPLAYTFARKRYHATKA